MAKKKKKDNFIFIEQMNPYEYDLLVCVGKTTKQVIAYLKRIEANEGIIKYVADNSDLFDGIEQGEQLGYAFINKKGGNEIGIILPKFKDTWSYWETLMHELNHVVDFLTQVKMLDGEIEARAYMHEHLFRQIRRKLQQ